MTVSLKRLVAETLAPAATDRPYALIDYPNYLNPGDAAIWLGARQVLEALNGRQPAYSSTLRHFSPRSCRRAIGNGVIYFTGGGNFGDLYPRHQQMRNGVLKAMPDNPIVLLPMSCAWSDIVDDILVAETVQLFGERSSLLVFARDQQAQQSLSERCRIESVLCPDLTHVLDFQAAQPKQEILHLLRKDREQKDKIEVSTIDAVDWRDSAGQRIMNKVGKLLLFAATSAMRAGLQDWVARQKVRLAVEALSAARTVVTDRLHAALLAGAIGRDVFVLDNATGKLHAYFETWHDLLPNGMKLQAGMEPERS